VRGLGLLVGVQLDFNAGPIVEAAREAGVLIITAGEPWMQMGMRVRVEEIVASRAPACLRYRIGGSVCATSAAASADGNHHHHRHHCHHCHHHTTGKGDVVRLVPPLTISEAEIDAACETLGRVINKVSADQK
jgi:acetylornithine/succinyldiaminopimelate/putrescine aminotransferase